MPGVPLISIVDDDDARTDTDLETDVYDHDQVDLNVLLETETTLGLEMKPLCSEGCRGLCPTCGANRNAEPCACAPTADPRWAPLKGLADRLSK